MAIIAQMELFSWEQVEGLGDLDRLRLVLEHLPDETLVSQLERARGNGRDDYPVRGLWNSLLAGVVFQHPSVESLRRELSRNGQLLALCGLRGVPPAWVYTRFFRVLFKYEARIDAMFDKLVGELAELLPGFGQHLALDSKAISSFAKTKPRDESADGRRDVDANFGRKTYRGMRKDGTPWEKITKWFGYKLHLVVDSTYELPVAFSLTKASEADINAGKDLIHQMSVRQPTILERAEVLTADKGYDAGPFLAELWDEYGIKPVIDIRSLWKDGDATRVLPGQTNVVYDQHGTVSCYCPATGIRREMGNGGFEKDRGTLKKLCPAKHYGIECKGRAACPVAGGLRVPLTVDRRIFTPVDRSSYAWKRLYKGRTAVERVNSRLDVSFGLEVHTIRGQRKMQFRAGLALCVMLALALGHIRERRPEKIRSLVA